MDDAEIARRLTQASRDIKRRFVTQKKLLHACATFEDIGKQLKPGQDAEFGTLVRLSQANCEKQLDHKESLCHCYMASGRSLFESAIKEIQNGHSITFEEYTDGIHFFEKAIQLLLSEGRTSLAGCYVFEMADYLKRILKLQDAAKRYLRAAEILNSHADWQLMSMWQGVCCFIYCNELTRVRDLLPSVLALAAEVAPTLHEDCTLILLMINTILSPMRSTIEHFVENILNSCSVQQQWCEGEELRILMKELCVAYVNGDAEGFREMEQILLPRISLEQHFLTNEMRFRCENPEAMFLA